MGKFMGNNHSSCKVTLLLDKLFTLLLVQAKPQYPLTLYGEWDKPLQIKCQSKATICYSPILLKTRIGLQPCVVYYSVWILPADNHTIQIRIINTVYCIVGERVTSSTRLVICQRAATFFKPAGYNSNACLAGHPKKMSHVAIC